MQVRNMNPQELVPYKKNAKKHTQEQIDNVAKSIEKFGFVQPIVVDKNNVIVIGHSRTLAAKKLGMKEVPVVMVDSLSEDEVRALRIADNKLNESQWDADALKWELNEINWMDYDLDFDFTGETRRKESWKHVEKKCDLKLRIGQYENSGFFYTAFYKTGKDGIPIDRIKEDTENVRLFADNVVEYLGKAIGHLGESWCIITAPKRRHKEFHFSSAVCELIAEDTGIPFYADAVECVNRHRIAPEFSRCSNPVEENIILYDDIVTTGETIRAARELFISDHAVFPVISIRNKG